MKRGTIERLQVERVTQPSVVVSRLFFFFFLFKNNISVGFCAQIVFVLHMTWKSLNLPLVAQPRIGVPSEVISLD